MGTLRSRMVAILWCCRTDRRYSRIGFLGWCLGIAVLLICAGDSKAEPADPTATPSSPGFLARIPLPPSDDSNGIYQLRFSPDNRILAARDGSQQIVLFDWRKRELISRLVGHEKRVQDFCFARDGRQLVTVTDDLDEGSRIWNVATGQFQRLPLAGRLVSEFPDDRVGIFTGQQAHLVQLPFNPLTQRTIDLSRDTRLNPLAVSSVGDLILYSSFRTPRDLLGHPSQFFLQVINSATRKSQQLKSDVGMPHDAVVFHSPFGKQVALICRRESRIIWLSSVEYQKNRAHEDAISDIGVTPDGRFLATCSWDGSTKIWEAASSELIIELKKLEGKALCLQFSSDGRMLATGSNSATEGIVVWDLQELLLGDRMSSTENSIQSHWDAIATNSASDAYRSVAWMANHEEDSLHFLEQAFESKAVEISPEQFAQWVNDLNNQSFDRRNTAFKHLYDLRVTLKPRLEEMRDKTDSVEIELQLRRILSAEQRSERLPYKERKRLARVIFLLESFDNPRADRILKSIANQESDDPIYQHAAQVWARRTGREF